jgi:peptidoglycan hydrolase-like protein with peptidoglycan-binding domain
VRRRLLVAGGGLVILAVAVGALVLALPPGRIQPAAEPASLPATAAVIRTTLVETRRVPGTLGYGAAAPISATGSGTLTWIAPVGSTVERGEPLFKVDERPVLALYGSVPLYRPLGVATEDSAQGADVRQLQENLAALGYKGFSVDGTYTSATAAAVRSWQTDLGLPTTGSIELGKLVFIPGPVRIAEDTARVGDLLAERGAPVLSYTGTTRLVSVELAVADQALAVEGGMVTVTIPGADTVEGEISEVGTVAAAEDEASAAGGGASAAASDARIEVRVTIADQAALGSLDAAPVDVDFVSQERKDVLAVPVAALLALADGGFGLDVVEGDTTRIVAVQTGMFAAGLVEVSGTGVAEGMRVGVPK